MLILSLFSYFNTPLLYFPPAPFPSPGYGTAMADYGTS